MGNWRKSAACWGSSVNFHSKNTAPAKLLCQRCPVIQQCRDWAGTTEQRERQEMPGVFGGLTERERRALYPLRGVA